MQRRNDLNFSSKEFLDLLRARNTEAITRLVNEYSEALFFGAIKQGLGEDQAEEVVQDTWSTFFKNVENFQGRSHIRTYLFGIMYNKTKEIWRSNKKYTLEQDENLEKLFTEDGNYLKAPQNPEIWSQSQEFTRILQEELDKLPEKQRMAFYLKEIQGEKTEDICNILDITHTNLGVLLYRAKNALRIRLEKRLNQ